MASNVDPLRLRAVLGREQWGVPQPKGPDGWYLVQGDRAASVIVTCAEQDDGREWIHASIARNERMPDYADLALLHRAAFGDQYAYQVFAPRRQHVNIHPRALHLWGRLDGASALPEFGRWGTI